MSPGEVNVTNRLLRAAAALVGVLPSAAHSTDAVYAQNFLTGSKQIVSYPVGNPGGMSVVGPLTDTLIGMDFDPGANVLWAINFATHALGTVNQSTGVFSQTVLLADTDIKAFTIDPVDGTFYVSRGDHYIYHLDATSGQTTLLGTGAAAGTAISALAADCSGGLYAFASNGVDLDVLYRTNLGSSDATPIASSGYQGATSLEFDNHTGTLYAWFNASGNTDSTHATINKMTAAASQTAAASGKYRMAIRNECPIFLDGFEA
jgi:hypothetical protein